MCHLSMSTITTITFVNVDDELAFTYQVHSIPRTTILKEIHTFDQVTSLSLLHSHILDLPIEPLVLYLEQPFL